MLPLCVLMLSVMGLAQPALLHDPRGQLILRPAADDVPQRCVEHSVTEVSCAAAPPDEDALLSHPDDCQLFYYCMSASSAPVCRACPAGLHFSPTERVCDHPERAGCSLSTTSGPGPATPPAPAPPGIVLITV